MTRKWEGETVCIIASGPSLTVADAQFARFAAKRVIAINNSWQMARRADVLYAADAGWWLGQDAPSFEDFAGERWSSERNEAWKSHAPQVNLIKTVQGADIADAPPIFEGINSAFQAMGLAVLWGACKIVFIGLDMSPGANGKIHWHEDHRVNNPNAQFFGACRQAFEKVAPTLHARGVTVINASRRTALTCFPQMPVTHALP